MSKQSAPSIDSIRIESLPCAILIPQAAPGPVQAFVECGTTCVPITSRDVWINKVVGDRSRDDAQLNLKEVLYDIMWAATPSCDYKIVIQLTIGPWQY